MNSLSSADNTSEGIDSTNGLNQIMQIKNIMDSMAVNKNDPRTNLLLSLKPYMREGRKHSIDSAVRLLGLTNVTKMLKNNMILEVARCIGHIAIMICRFRCNDVMRI